MNILLPETGSRSDSCQKCRLQASDEENDGCSTWQGKRPATGQSASSAGGQRQLVHASQGDGCACSAFATPGQSVECWPQQPFRKQRWAIQTDCWVNYHSRQAATIKDINNFCPEATNGTIGPPEYGDPSAKASAGRAYQAAKTHRDGRLRQSADPARRCRVARHFQRVSYWFAGYR
jgi:hypothetical protein